MAARHSEELKNYVLELRRVERYLNDKIREQGTIALTLGDPDVLMRQNITPKEYAEVAKLASDVGVTAQMLGGSTNVTESMIDGYAKEMKKRIEEPVIGFPASPEGISKELDAIWFMSLLNSRNPYYIVGAARDGAPKVKKYNLEPIPMAYLVVEPGGTVGQVADVNLLLKDKPELAVAYAQGAGLYGFRWAYLEAGSGAEEPVPNEMVYQVKKAVDIRVGCGGGIATNEQAREKAAHGAEFEIIGTRAEKLIKKPKVLRESLEEMVEAIREGAKKRKG